MTTIALFIFSAFALVLAAAAFAILGAILIGVGEILWESFWIRFILTITAGAVVADTLITVLRMW